MPFWKRKNPPSPRTAETSGSASPKVGDHDHCSLTGGGATNPVSNWTQIIAMDSAVLVPLIIKNGRLPPLALPTFMHEMMHHWCFHSPVGTALAMTQLRAQRSAVEMSLCRGKDVDDLSWNTFYDALRFEAVNSMLRPLSEGLALFAEFDALPGTSSVISTVCKSVGLWFGEPDRMIKALQNDRLIEEIGMIILRTRMTTKAYKLKANLLAQPALYDPQSQTHSVQGGYLLGYMALKNIRIALIRKGCGAFQDTDLFLTYVRSYIFDDYGLVARIMAPADNEVEYLDDLIQHLRIRMHMLLQNTTPGDVARFEKLSAARQDLGPSPFHRSPINADPTLWAQGLELLDAMQEVLGSGAPDSVVTAHRRSHQWMLARRMMACVCTFKDLVKVANGRVLTGHSDEFGGMPTINIPVLPGIPEQEGEGLVQCFIVPDRNLRIISVSLGGRAVAVMFLGSEDEAFKADFIQYELDGKNADMEASHFEAAVRAIIADLGMDDFKANLMQRFGQVTALQMLDFALMFVSNDQLEVARAKLEDGGLYAVLGQDFQALQALATASMLGTMTEAPLAQKVLRGEGYELDAMLQRCRTAARTTGVQTADRIGQMILVSV